jgi:hypothetical protein
MTTSVAMQLPEQLSQDEAKLAQLRADIRVAVDQVERGEVIRNFDVKVFLAKRPRAGGPDSSHLR